MLGGEMKTHWLIGLCFVIAIPAVGMTAPSYPYLEVDRNLEDTCQTLASEGKLAEDLTSKECINAVYYFLYGDTTKRAEDLATLLLSGISLPFPLPDVIYPHPPEGLGTYFASPSPVLVDEAKRTGKPGLSRGSYPKKSQRDLKSPLTKTPTQGPARHPMIVFHRWPVTTGMFASSFLLAFPAGFVAIRKHRGRTRAR
jgi:hypothetical protein